MSTIECAGSSPSPITRTNYSLQVKFNKSAPSNSDDGGFNFLTPIYTLSEKRQLISDHTKGPLVAVFRSPLMKALDRSVKTLGL